MMQWGVFVPPLQNSNCQHPNYKPWRKNGVRSFNLVPGRDCKALKGRTTIAFGIQPVRLPRFTRNDI
ncbi:TPA: hypothetical protein DEP21_03430 [Patescibacteria group bacterium]|nr:hypothetical protein [Candidatus Gracilibacteria bacterium]